MSSVKPRENARENSDKSSTEKDEVATASQAFSAILRRVGDSGRYQTQLMVIAGFCGFFTAFHNLGASFLAATPEHWCQIPNLNLNKSLTRNLQNYTVPWIRGKTGTLVPSTCEYFNTNYTSLNPDELETNADISENNLLSCTSWFYDESVHLSTVVTEWDLVCSKRWLMSTTQASYMLGILIGAVFFSALSDKIGRRKSALICSALFFISSVLASFSVSFEMFLILRFIIAVSGQGLFLINFVILMECSGKKARSIHGNIFHMFFGFGLSFLPLLAYFFRDWRDLQLAIALPTVVLLGYFWILPESPRWLLMNRRFEEGLFILRNIANCNNGSMPDEDELNLYLEIINKEVLKDDPKTFFQKVWSAIEDMLVLVKTPNMRRRSLITFYAWFVVSMMYYGLTFSSSNINSSIFITILIAGIVEIPAGLITAFFTLRCGRRMFLVVTMILSGLACIAIIFVPKEMVEVNLTLSSFGKMLSTCAFLVVFIFSAELVPTHVRNTSVGVASMFARIGSGAAPYIVDLLGDVYYAIPSTIFGVLALLSGVLSLLLPETGKTGLPESIEEIERMEK